MLRSFNIILGVGFAIGLVAATVISAVGCGEINTNSERKALATNVDSWNSPDYDTEVSRQRVPGGWLYVVTNGYQGGCACTFVPDTNVEKDR